VSPSASERRVLFVCTHNAGRSIVAADLVVTMSEHPAGPTISRASTPQQHWQLDFPVTTWRRCNLRATQPASAS
jgi:hypothetical protein